MSSAFNMIRIFTLVFCLSVCFGSCQSEKNTGWIKNTNSIEAKTQHPVPQRVICAAPSVTEFVFALGLGYRVIGVSDFSTHPPEAAEKSRVGGLINPSKEKIVALRPDILILQGRNSSIARLAEEHGFRFLAVEINSVRDIWKAIRLMGQVFSAQEEAERLVGQIRKELGAVRELTHNRPVRKVFLTLGHTPGDLTGLTTTGPRTFIHELVSLAGGENVFRDATGMYPQISKESLIKRQPGIIIEAIPGGIEADKLRLLKKDWSQLPMLPAVRTGRIHFLTEDYLLIPGTRIAQTVRRFAQIIHPEVFGEEGDA